MSSSLQPLPTPPAFRPHHSDSIPMLLPVLIVFFVFICLLSLFLFRDLFHYLSGTCLCSRTRRGRPAQNANAEPHQEGDPGLDPVIISSFPTLPYSAVRGLQEGKCGAGCAVCLSEFNGGDVIRLLTVCCHAFHPTCIDPWLASHTTCPICRSDLEAPPDETAVLAVRDVVGGGPIDSHIIVVEDESIQQRASLNKEEQQQGMP